MPLKCSGMQNILNGFLRYRINLRGELLKTFESVGDNPDPSSIVITCVDSRIVASRIIQANPGDTFMARNPGSLVPNYSMLDSKTPRAEEAALELACVHNNINTIVVAGHSDCKAMNLVYDNRMEVAKPCPKSQGVLKSWLMANSTPTINKFLQLEKENFKNSLTFNISKTQSFKAFIDPDNQFAMNDKFSQLNTLTQLENLKNFSFLKDKLEKKQIMAYALWLDIYTGDVYVFSYKEKCFVKLEEASYEKISRSINY